MGHHTSGAGRKEFPWERHALPLTWGGVPHVRGQWAGRTPESLPGSPRHHCPLEQTAQHPPGRAWDAASTPALQEDMPSRCPRRAPPYSGPVLAPPPPHNCAQRCAMTTAPFCLGKAGLLGGILAPSVPPPGSEKGDSPKEPPLSTQSTVCQKLSQIWQTVHLSGRPTVQKQRPQGHSAHTHHQRDVSTSGPARRGRSTLSWSPRSQRREVEPPL